MPALSCAGAQLSRRPASLLATVNSLLIARTFARLLLRVLGSFACAQAFTEVGRSGRLRRPPTFGHEQLERRRPQRRRIVSGPDSARSLR